MHLNRPDPTAESMKQASRRFRGALTLVLGFIAVLWAILLIDQIPGVELRQFGVRPHTPGGLLGLLSMPLIHGGFVHLLKNTLPTLTLGVALLYFYPNTSLRALPWFWVVPGAFVWIVGQPGSTHFGASGLNFALLGYVALGGLLRRDAGMLAVSLAVLFYYGGMLSGVLPIEPGVSWEGHLGGLLVGLALAIAFRREDIPPRRRYAYEDEEEADEAGETLEMAPGLDANADDLDPRRTLH